MSEPKAKGEVRFASGHVEEIADAWDYLQSLDERYPPKPNPERDARFEQVMARRKPHLQPQPAPRRRRAKQ